MTSGQSLFEAYLNQYDDNAWRQVVKNLLSSIHEVDRNATQIWFHFFPLALTRALEQARRDDTEQEFIHRHVLLGNWRLDQQIDSSHRFLFGHRFWPQVKAAVSDFASAGSAPPASLDLAAQILEVADQVAKQLQVERSLLTGITAVAFLTLQHTGLQVFKASTTATKPGGLLAKLGPDKIIRWRGEDERQGPLKAFLGIQKIFKITFDENNSEGSFDLMETQHLTTAAAADKRDHYLRDSRCTPNEGPIPVQCRSASCGTCWVGVLGGSDKLSPVTDLERRRIREFGYIDSQEERPIIRLSCRAQAFGNASIVIPPWNGVIGRLMRNDDPPKVEAQVK